MRCYLRTFLVDRHTPRPTPLGVEEQPQTEKKYYVAGVGEIAERVVRRHPSNSELVTH